MQKVQNKEFTTIAVFRVLRKPMLLAPENASKVVLTVALLHNFLRQRPKSNALYNPPGTYVVEQSGNVTHGSWRKIANDESSSLHPLRNVPRRARSNF
jgi:hypothetical protein